MSLQRSILLRVLGCGCLLVAALFLMIGLLVVWLAQQ